MIDTDGLVLVQGVLDNVRQMANDTHDFIWAVRRSLILQSVMVAVLGLVTLFNFWMLGRVLKLMNEVIRLVKELADEAHR